MGLLIREGLAQGLDKTRLSPGNAIGPLIFREIDTVHIVRVGIPQMNAFPNPQVLAEATDVSAFLHPADDVHSRIEQYSEALETLQTAPDDGIFFKHGDLHPLFGKDGTRKQAAEAAADDDRTFFHTNFCSI